jgi:hypothetical protein
MCDLGQDPWHEAIRDRLLDRLYAEWKPERILAEAQAQDRDLCLLERWGQTVQPRLEDTVPVPATPEVELL